MRLQLTLLLAMGETRNFGLDAGTIAKKAVQRRTVSQALDNRIWVSDIKGALTVQLLSLEVNLEYLGAYELQVLHLAGLEQQMLVVGPTGQARLAPPTCLALLRSSGGDHQSHPRWLCAIQIGLDQDPVGTQISYDLTSQLLKPTHKASASLDKNLRKGFNSLVILVAWLLWKHRNARVFDGTPPQVQTVLSQVAAEGHLWCLAGAAGLQELLSRSAQPP
ncbi:hypothetical protein U9M48_014121 [Paspalum notatum var. saurae]|uniref:Uncharacterized protein n=1 Tax=Paspalum notatum var. saurae TaxID=547442 RepID=A0AAQ3T267_PASNO